MTPELAEAIQTLRSNGFAVTVFNPEELRGANPGYVEDMMVERGWNAIDTLSNLGDKDE